MVRAGRGGEERSVDRDGVEKKIRREGKERARKRMRRRRERKDLGSGQDKSAKRKGDKKMRGENKKNGENSGSRRLVPLPHMCQVQHHSVWVLSHGGWSLLVDG